MKNVRLLGLAVLPMAIAQCAPAGCAPTPGSTPPPANCNSNYSPCVPNDPVDVDCAGGGGNGPSFVAGPVRVIGVDVYGLDANGDGIGCES